MTFLIVLFFLNLQAGFWCQQIKLHVYLEIWLTMVCETSHQLFISVHCPILTNVILFVVIRASIVE